MLEGSALTLAILILFSGIMFFNGGHKGEGAQDWDLLGPTTRGYFLLAIMALASVVLLAVMSLDRIADLVR